jgi:hypothetical protein
MLYSFRVADASATQPLPVDKWIKKFLARLALATGLALVFDGLATGEVVRLPEPITL